MIYKFSPLSKFYSCSYFIGLKHPIELSDCPGTTPAGSYKYVLHTVVLYPFPEKYDIICNVISLLKLKYSSNYKDVKLVNCDDKDYNLMFKK